MWFLIEATSLMEQEMGMQLQYLWRMGIATPRHMGSSWTRDQTCVPYIGRDILFFSFFKKLIQFLIEE